MTPTSNYVFYVEKDGAHLQERGYPSASECTDNIGKAMKYYTDRKEEVVITMYGKDGVCLARIEVKNKQKDNV